MERTKLETYINRDLERDLQILAAVQGKAFSELVEQAVSDYVVGAGGLRSELFEGIRRYQREQGTPEPSEEEAMRIANEEVHRYREENIERYTSHTRNA